MTAGFAQALHAAVSAGLLGGYTAVHFQGGEEGVKSGIHCGTLPEDSTLHFLKMLRWENDCRVRSGSECCCICRFVRRVYTGVHS